MQCPSDAESIAECSATIDSDGSCLESNGAGVKCYSSKFIYNFNKTNKQANTYYFLQIETKCAVSNFFSPPSEHEECDTEEDVRIVGGDQDNEGQPQVCNGSNWNPICDESWDDDVATLFCKKLGYASKFFFHG